MKNKLKMLLAMLAAVLCIGFAVACDEPHEHTFAETWSSDATHHWHAATCEHTEEQSDKAEHTLTETVITEATYLEKGSAKKVCICGYETAEYELEKLTKPTPTYTIPTNLTATYGDILSTVVIENPTNGEWTWADGSVKVGAAGERTFAAIFTPDDENYATVEEELTVTVSPYALTDEAIAEIAAQTYSGVQLTPSVTVTGLNGALEESEYEVEYGNNVNVADGGSVTVTLSGNYTGTLTKTFEITAKDASSATVTVEDIVQGATAKAVVILDGYTIVEGTDYTVDYADSAVASENATATVTFSGNYSGAATGTYVIEAFENGVDVFLDFNGEITDRKNARATSMVGENPVDTYVDGNDGSKAIALVAGKKTGVHIENSPLGTDDFTIAMDVKLDMTDIASGTNEGNAILETGAHILYGGNNGECNGLNCNATKGCDGLHKDVVKVSLTRTNDEYKLRVQFAKDANSTNTNVTLSAEQLAQIMDAGTGEGKWFNLALVMDRRVSVVGNNEMATAYVYLNGELLTEQLISYEIGQGGEYYVLGDGNIYLGGYNTWTSGGGIKYRDRQVDNFIIYKGVLEQNQIKNTLTSYVDAMNSQTDWYVEDVEFDFIEVMEQNDVNGGYVATLNVIGGNASIDELLLDDAPTGITLEKEGSVYSLVFTAEGLQSVIDGKELIFSANGIEKTITVIYYGLEEIFVDDVVIYDFEIINGELTKKIKVTAGNDIGLADVEFSGELADKITAGAVDGEYVLTLTSEALAAITEAKTLTARVGALEKSFSVSVATASLVNETTEYTSSNSAADVTKVVEIGTSSITIGFNLHLPESFTGLIDVFATKTARGSGAGFRVTFKQEAGKYQFCVQSHSLGLTPDVTWYTFSNFDYLDETIAFVIQIDRTSATKFDYSFYINGERVKVDSSYKESYDVAETFTPQGAQGIIFGYGGTNGTDTSNSALVKGWKFSDIVINKSLCATELSKALIARQA